MVLNNWKSRATWTSRLIFNFKIRAQYLTHELIAAWLAGVVSSKPWHLIWSFRLRAWYKPRNKELSQCLFGLPQSSWQKFLISFILSIKWKLGHLIFSLLFSCFVSKTSFHYVALKVLSYWFSLLSAETVVMSPSLSIRIFFYSNPKIQYFKMWLDFEIKLYQMWLIMMSLY